MAWLRWLLLKPSFTKEGFEGGFEEGDCDFGGCSGGRDAACDEETVVPEANVRCGNTEISQMNFCLNDEDSF